MKVILTPTYFLSDEWPEWPQPVLVNRVTCKTYGPGDMIQAYPDWEFQPAASAVRKMTSWGKRSQDQREFIGRFKLAV